VIEKLKYIHTGNRYSQYTYWCSRVQKSFNCLVINSKKAHNLDLRHTRGTSVQLQKTIRRGSNFEKVATNIVNCVENEKLSKIGVYCKSGHHRAVAMGEMIMKYVYKNAKVKHLTIHR
jgi:methylthioribose-1-phosphate isomerase